MISNSLNGRTIHWTNGDKEPSLGIIRDAYVGMTQTQNAISKIIMASPVWLFLVEVLEPPKYANTFTVIEHNERTIRIDAVA